MSRIKFFSNNLITLDHKENEITFSLPDTRDDYIQQFKVPKHTVGTNNLLVFLDGRLVISDVHYEDINSHYISFYEPVPTDIEIYTILIKTSKDKTLKDSEVIEWQSF